MKRIIAQPLTAHAFAPFGEVLEAAGTPDKIINAGFCSRYHDRAQLDFGTDGRAGVSIFKAEPRTLPYRLDLLERHPDGSQAFIPMSMTEWLVIVATGDGPEPGAIHAFLAAPGQGINLRRGCWHGVLTPLHAPGLYAVVDRIGTTPNLEEFTLPDPVEVTASA